MKSLILLFHRLAGDGQVHGLFQCVLNYCKNISQNIRADTHADNQIMQKLMEKNGFMKCGIIYVKMEHQELHIIGLLHNFQLCVQQRAINLAGANSL